MAHQQLSIQEETPAYWRVTIDHPPINLVDGETLLELHKLVARLEASTEVKVVVFDSADPDFFIAHWDSASSSSSATLTEPAPTWIDISQRLARLPVVSIALVRGRARGIGSEIALGFDMRFASVERAIFGQPEVGVGLVPGGGAMERLPLLAGRARTLEIVLGANDFDAVTAERYGWINRAIPDAQLDDFVASLALRLASFDRQALAAGKETVNRGALPDVDDLHASQMLFYQALSWPGAQARYKPLMKLGIGRRSELEMNFGEHLPKLLDK